MSELFPACFSCSISLNLSQSLSGSDYRNIVFELPEAMIAGDLTNFIGVLSLADFLPCPLSSKCISFAKSYINFLSCQLARSTL